MPTDQPTIQAGIDASHDGDTVLVAPGTYNENIDFKGKAINVTSGAKQFSGAAATIIKGRSDGYVVSFETSETASAVLNGFTIRGGHSSSAASKYTGGISISAASPTITNNIVTDNIGCGIIAQKGSNSVIQSNDIVANHDDQSSSYEQCYGGADITGTGLAIDNAGYVQVLGNLIEDNRTSLPAARTSLSSAIFITLGKKVLLQDNIVRNNVESQFPGLDESYTVQLVMVQNLFYQNQPGPGFGANYQLRLLGGYGAGGSYPSLTEISNTIYGGGEALIDSFGASEVANNIFYTSLDVMTPTGAESNDGGVYCGTTTPESFNFHNNDIFNNGLPVPFACNSGAGGLAVDPQFLDSTGSDFHTKPTSPVIAAGDITVPGISARDLDGKNRFVCGTIDMGAYEHHPQAPIALTTSTNPSVGGTPVTFTAQLTGNCNVPTGVVTFLDGTAVLGTGTLDGSALATFTTAGLTVGSHNITATYPGDFNFDPSTSNVVVQVVTGYPTTTTLQVSPNPATALQTITLSSTVSSNFGTPTGTVTFFAGANALATATLSASGFATATVNTPGAGTYNIMAIYQATTDYASSQSPIVVEIVNGAATAATLVSAPNPSAFGQSVIFTANVSASASTATPTGTVSFFDGAALLNTAPLSGTGSATYSTAALSLGNHNIKAIYSGSTNDNASTSNVVVQVVVPAATSVGLTAAPNPANFGQVVTFTASVSTAVSDLPSPAGTVVFADQSGPLGSAALVGGQAVFMTSSLTVGTHNVTATFAGSSGFAAASSAVLAEVVQNFDFTLAVTPSTPVIPSGDYEELSVTLTPVGGFNDTVNLSCAPLPAHAECLFSSGSVTLAGVPQTVTVTLNTSDLIGYGYKVGELYSGEGPRPWHGVPILAGIFLPTLLLSQLRGRSRRGLLMLLALVALLGQQGCTGKVPAKTPLGTYPIAITGSSGTIKHSIPLSLRVTR